MWGEWFCTTLAFRSAWHLDVENRCISSLCRSSLWTDVVLAHEPRNQVHRSSNLGDETVRRCTEHPDVIRLKSFSCSVLSSS